MNAGDSALDPDIRRFLALLRAAGFDPGAVPIEQAREGARTLRLPWNRGGPAMAASHEGVIAGLRYRLHVPRLSAAPQPFTIYLHGGGWTLLDIDTHDALARSIAEASGRPLLLLDYPRAPEHQFPEALHRLHDAMTSLDRVADLRDLDRGAYMLAGDSAGANLALGLSLLLGEKGGPEPKALALFYGCFAPTFEGRSHRAYGDGSLPLTTARMQWFWDNYAPGEDLRRDPLAVPMLAALDGLPPVFLGVASHDVLLDENLALATRLGESGNDLTLRVHPGTIHGFIEAAGAVGATVAQRALSEAGMFIAAHLAEAAPATDSEGTSP